MLVTLVLLSLVHRRQREEARERRQHYWHEQVPMIHDAILDAADVFVLAERAQEESHSDARDDADIYVFWTG